MKPIIILPPKTVSAADLKLLRDNGICVVEAKNPAAVKFVDSIPAIASRTAVEDAAIQLSRKILTPNFYNDETRGKFALMLVEALIKGTPLDHRPTQQEQEVTIFNGAKADELRRLAREEAKAEREAARKLAEANKSKATPPTKTP